MKRSGPAAEIGRQPGDEAVMNAEARAKRPARQLQPAAQLPGAGLGIGGIDHVMTIEATEIIDAGLKRLRQALQRPEVGWQLQSHLDRQDPPGGFDQLEQILLLGTSERDGLSAIGPA